MRYAFLTTAAVGAPAAAAEMSSTRAWSCCEAPRMRRIAARCSSVVSRGAAAGAAAGAGGPGAAAGATASSSVVCASTSLAVSELW